MNMQIVMNGNEGTFTGLGVEALPLDINREITKLQFDLLKPEGELESLESKVIKEPKTDGDRASNADTLLKGQIAHAKVMAIKARIDVLKRAKAMMNHEDNITPEALLQLENGQYEVVSSENELSVGGKPVAVKELLSQRRDPAAGRQSPPSLGR